MTTNVDRIASLSVQVSDLKKRWPAHSVPPAMMAQLDELEEELDKEFKSELEAGAFRFQPIGYVVNEFREPTKQDTISASSSRIILSPDLLECLTGLEPGMTLLVIFVFHLADGYEPLQHPRGDRERPMRGVFTLRSPNRPNPIGVTQVEVLAVDGNILTVRGLDAIHGTPVLDLKST